MKHSAGSFQRSAFDTPREPPTPRRGATEREAYAARQGSAISLFDEGFYRGG